MQCRTRILCAAPMLLSIAGGAHAQQGAVQHVHDPVMIREGQTFYVFSSGPGVPVRRSTDLVHWELAGRVFDRDVPAWGLREIPGARDVWAPDISRRNGQFHLYYAVSTPGSQRSCIGLATNRTLDPASPEYRWVDHGRIFESFPGRTDYNAIDANLVLDESDRPWLLFGSFWGGLKLIRLEDGSGRPHPDDHTVHALAARPDVQAIEGGFLVRKAAYYYLFASYDHCCRGLASNYKVMVGRSRAINGPYVDFDGRPMLEAGSGTLVLAGYGEWRGPGHNGILLDAEGDWMVHHMYDAARGGIPTMQIRPLLWTADGWPVVGEPVSMPPAASRPAAVSLAGTWKHSVNFGAEEYMELLADGRLNAAVDRATWAFDGTLLHLRWPSSAAPAGAWIDDCFVAPDGNSYVGRNQRGAVIRGQRRISASRPG